MRFSSLCCKARRFGVIVAVAIAIASSVASSDAATLEHRGIAIDVVGAGRPVLMIPGLNSAADVWRDTCAALQSARVQCHLVQLPGFAGRPAQPAAAFMATMRDALLDYMEQHDLAHAAVVGHSLGGVLALQMALQRPDAVERIVVVDALPFLPAAHQPAATVDTTRPYATRLRDGLLAADDAAYRAQALSALQGLTNAPARVPTLQQWGEASDRATTVQAMYELMTTDLRDDVRGIAAPTLVLGAWAGYAAFGATRDSVAATFAQQYAALPGVRIALSDGGYHFLMWDDPQWLQQQVRDFLAEPAAALP